MRPPYGHIHLTSAGALTRPLLHSAVITQEIKMQTVIAIVCLALLLWIEPASAEDHSLKVRVHNDVLMVNQISLQQLTEKVDSILEKASMRLMDQGHCDVTLKRDGPIEPFTSKEAPSIIKNPKDLERVHSVSGHVKIVRAILSCIGRPPFVGCSFRPDPHLRKTMIVNRGLGESERPNIWAHEFGHTTGLHHRKASGPN